MAVFHVDTIVDADVRNALLVLYVLSYALLPCHIFQNRYVSCLYFYLLFLPSVALVVNAPNDLMCFSYFGARRYEGCLSCCPSMNSGD